MSTDSKRTTIYLSKDLEETLDKLKQEKFYRVSQSHMINYLIKLGAESEAKSEIEKPAS